MRFEGRAEALHPSPWVALSHLHSSNQHRDANENVNEPIYERDSLLVMTSQSRRRVHLPTNDEPSLLAEIELNKNFILDSAAMEAHQAFKVQTQYSYEFVLCCGRCETAAVEYHLVLQHPCDGLTVSLSHQCDLGPPFIEVIHGR